MILQSIIAISLGASAGALLRWGFGLMLNPIFPTVPLGTLAANLVGGFLMGIFMGVIKNHGFVPEAMRLAIATGFLGGLTTFSTFSAETVSLLSYQEFFWASMIIIGHVVGSILMTILGIFAVKLIIA